MEFLRDVLNVPQHRPSFLSPPRPLQSPHPSLSILFYFALSFPLLSTFEKLLSFPLPVPSPPSLSLSLSLPSSILKLPALPPMT